ncbi:hypothetical protein [uncultured Methanobrevibacter sp.]|uniref:hypothetical protein n=1 Tax=uncultured Methanobrevibacter sp. TaxID=253161 RepID=UPI00258F18FB|nr:hypothetical protein [uncultured Methanobrevibacter sp.]
MKKSHNLIIIIILICLIFAVIAVVAGSIESSNDTSKETVGVNNFTESVSSLFINKPSKDPSIIGENENGTVSKYYYGNKSSNETIIIILGVHDLESGIHNATNETLKERNDSNNLSKNYVVYFVKINHNQTKYNVSDYNTNRRMGELLANDHIVNDTKQYNPKLVMDVHEMEVYYDSTTFLLPITEDSKGEEDGTKLANLIGVEKHATYTAGTSPQYVTEPISNLGYESMIFEVNQGYNQSTKKDYAERLINAIETFE